LDLVVARDFRPVDRDTGFLLPPDVREWLPVGHLAWTVIDAVETLDLAALISSYRLGGRGRRAYDPTMMLTLLIYAYAVGQTSSRQIEASCEHDVAFRVITANQTPDHDTIAAFRVRHRDVFSDLFVQVLALCRAAGLARVGTIAVDGTKLAANASSRANRTAAGIDKALAELDGPDGPDGRGGLAGSDGRGGLAGVVEARVAAAERADAAEDAEHGPGRRGDEPPEQMRGSHEGRRATLLAAKAELQAREQAAAAEQADRQARHEQRVADREAHRQAHGSYPPGRPPQPPPPPPPQPPSDTAPASKPLRVNTTDLDSRPQRTARGFLQGFNAQAAVAEDQVIVAVEIVCQANDVGQLAPMLAAATTNLTAAGITEPVQTVLADAGYHHRAQIAALTAAHREQRGPDVLVPPDRDALRDPDQQHPPQRETSTRKQMRERLAEPDARARYRRRQTIVEPVFGQIKNRITDRFRLRGLPAVRSELTLIATAHNLLKLHTATT
jgi:transposase